ncbi:MAG: hypothetical protein N2Z71_00400 [Caloramator sp.]|nr:hypothetical protein [Caloramator sp.]
MFIILFTILWGILLCLVLSAPFSYTPLFMILFIISIAVLVSAKKMLIINKKYIIYSIISFIFSYVLSCYVIFKPHTQSFINFGTISQNKKAVIFYCEGEMEKYTPYYTNYFLQKTPFYLKPIYSYKIKKIYSELEVNSKNNNLSLVARDVKSSILSYKPYYFYIAYSGYTPTLKDAIVYAVNDGCSEIIIINYTANNNLMEKTRKYIDYNKLTSNGVNIKFTKSVQETGEFQQYITEKIINMPAKFDGIILLTKNTDIATIIKSHINENYRKDDIFLITDDLDYGIRYFIEKGCNNVLYICLDESSSGIMAEYYYPKIALRYSDKIKIVGIKDWGYDKLLVKAAIKCFLEEEKK